MCLQICCSCNLAYPCVHTEQLTSLPTIHPLHVNTDPCPETLPVFSSLSSFFWVPRIRDFTAQLCHIYSTSCFLSIQQKMIKEAVPCQCRALRRDPSKLPIESSHKLSQTKQQTQCFIL